MVKDCNLMPKVKYFILVKKGMAEKAMIKNLKTGNTELLKKQISKGTVNIKSV